MAYINGKKVLGVMNTPSSGGGSKYTHRHYITYVWRYNYYNFYAKFIIDTNDSAEIDTRAKLKTLYDNLVSEGRITNNRLPAASGYGTYSYQGSTSMLTIIDIYMQSTTDIFDVINMNSGTIGQALTENASTYAQIKDVVETL